MSEPNTVIAFDGRDEAAALTLQLIQQARQQICFFGQTLDKALFDNVVCVDAIQSFLLASPRSSLQVLLRDSELSAKQSHRLTPLIDKLSSRVTVRQCDKLHQDISQSLLLIDRTAYLQYPKPSRYQGTACVDAPGQSQQYQQLFDTVWQQGHADSFSRRLHL